MSRKNSLTAIVIVFALIVLAGVLYERIVPDLSSARTDQSQVETAVATWLLHRECLGKDERANQPCGN